MPAPFPSESDGLHHHRLRAAVGFCELGMLQEAWEELAELPPEAAKSPPALEVTLLLHLRERSWNRALDVSVQLCEALPDSPTGYIHAAYCLHELGRTREARDMLTGGPECLRTEPVFYYNLGCYMASLGALIDAEDLLRVSFEMDERLEQVAKSDPDLRELWDVL